MKSFFPLLAIIFCLFACKSKQFDTDTHLNYCVAQATKTVPIIPDYCHGPNNFDKDATEWRFNNPSSWTGGFWPGILWYISEYTKDPQWVALADSFTHPVIPAVTRRASTHDIGFIAFCSIGNGYRLTKNPEYKLALLQAADSLAWLFNPNVGSFLSWPNMVARMNWPHNTIIDNMMNMELMFWAGKNGNNPHLYDIAAKHSKTTMNHQFRDDYSTYHVIVYNDSTGERIKGVTHQGYADETIWARGQAWAIYGFTMAYRETKNPYFLDIAEKATDIYLKRLPKDMIPYWDFDAPNIPNEPRDASAAAITASALLELSVLTGNKIKSKEYRKVAEKILTTLSSDEYQSRDKNSAFLLHCVGHIPNGYEIDASIIYADYYYIEALIRLKKLQEGKSIYENL